MQISAANLHTATSSKQSSFENFSFIHADAAIATAFVSCIVVVLVVVVDVFCVNVIDAEIITCNAPDVAVVIISSDRSSCTDDGRLYIYPATFSDFEHLCLSILLQVSL